MPLKETSAAAVELQSWVRTLRQINQPASASVVMSEIQ